MRMDRYSSSARINRRGIRERALLPNKGRVKGEGKTINCPFPRRHRPRQIIDAFKNRLLPAAKQFQPDLILISAGFDSRVNDPLGQFLLTDNTFRELTGMMTDLAAEYCDGRLVSVLEGGYGLEGLAMATEAHLRGLMGA